MIRRDKVDEPRNTALQMVFFVAVIIFFSAILGDLYRKQQNVMKKSGQNPSARVPIELVYIQVTFWPWKFVILHRKQNKTLP